MATKSKGTNSGLLHFHNGVKRVRRKSEPEELVMASLTSGQGSEENDELVVSVVFDLEGHASTFSQLETLDVNCLYEVEHFWKYVQPGFQGFQNVRDLRIDNCDSLKYLCPYEIYKLPLNLQEVVTMNCKNMETIILAAASTEDNIHEEGKETGGSGAMTLFPKLLNWFKLTDMLNLERFFPDAYSFAWPSPTRTLWVVLCPKLKTLGFAPLSKKLPATVAENLSDDRVRGNPSTQAFDKLRQLTLIGLPMMSHIWEKAKLLTCLEKLVVEHCSAMEKIVGEAEGGGESIEDELTFLHVNSILLVNLPELESLCSEAYTLNSYQVVESMRLGMEPNLAAKDAISRIVRKLPDFLGAVFAINKKGVHAGACHG
ncbi:unnamed protein product [Prunus brigantina]